ncbi:triose-phosphate isomerase [Candidatus Berkelbacteria bacterium]|nr:triose-phosphate isomerase [Candidatus Berkelbacteria bacterium]
MARRPLIVGNWKMQTNVEEALHLGRGILHALQDKRWELDVAICPPLPWIVPVEAALGRSQKLQLGAQDATPGAFGAETGNVSLGMLKPHVQFVIVGHSERRLSGESHQTINAKLRDALKRGITPILCVGEFVALYENKRKRGRPTKLEAESNIAMQLRRALREISPTVLGKLVVAYEPVWAIGTGNAASPEYAGKMIRKLRRTLARIAGKRRADKIRILYGGSVNAKNAADYAAVKGIDGALVGGASLDIDEFVGVVQAFSR